ncbi:hypothetical protein LX32DRAFT_147602 [Colletotrichum zoysiae]|uniref:Uncharacterized protein n=1 Tax=Colletotrichum zoysiae TaxID=1216348 RepID=A0AAD9LV70_9PEZI|nr:hypothetical protein LX32DRAFT_147602 [Colletotrichum zoysiae]
MSIPPPPLVRQEDLGCIKWCFSHSNPFVPCVCMCVSLSGLSPPEPPCRRFVPYPPPYLSRYEVSLPLRQAIRKEPSARKGGGGGGLLSRPPERSSLGRIRPPLPRTVQVLPTEEGENRPSKLRAYFEALRHANVLSAQQSIINTSPPMVRSPMPTNYWLDRGRGGPTSFSK